MSARHYIKSAERIEGQMRSCVRLTCRGCGVQTAMPMTGFRALPDDVIERKFKATGWVVGANENWDFCPACNTKKKEPKVSLKVVEQAPVPAPDKPREMGRDDRRIVFEKLNEVYLDEKRGYDSGWSDHRVATDLGVPRKWVEDVRIELFGDNGGSEDMRQFLREAESLLAEAKALFQKAKEEREKATRLLDEITKNNSNAALQDRVNRIEKLAGEVRKLMVTG